MIASLEQTNASRTSPYYSQVPGSEEYTNPNTRERCTYDLFVEINGSLQNGWHVIGPVPARGNPHNCVKMGGDDPHGGIGPGGGHRELATQHFYTIERNAETPIVSVAPTSYVDIDILNQDSELWRDNSAVFKCLTDALSTIDQFRTLADNFAKSNPEFP